MAVVRVKAKVVTDDTGIKTELLVLLTDQGPVRLLIDYFRTRLHLSSSWQNQVLSSVKLMVEYLQANQYHLDDPELIFATFAARLYSGTIGDDGLDQSGLGWVPASLQSSARHILALEGFLTFASRKIGKISPYPLVQADSYDQMLNYAAWYWKNQENFLGHIEDKSVAAVIQQARIFRPRGRLSVLDSTIPTFPQSLFRKMYFDGFGGKRDPRCVIRDRLILLLMDGGGARESEALHLWLVDVQPDPANPKSAYVRLYHPEDGRAPDEHLRTGRKMKRAAYLRTKYGLIPRNRLNGSQRVGWKAKVVDHADNYLHIFWFPPSIGELFMQLWQNHVRYMAPIKRHHPYAFISYEASNFGEPYSLNALNANYEAALARIGMTPSKQEGRSTHGHRHAFSQRMKRAGLDPVVIRKALHQKSLASQARYTKSTISEVTQAMTDALSRLEGTESAARGKAEPHYNWDDFLRSGFEDIDPQGLLSGPHPTLRSH